MFKFFCSGLIKHDEVDLIHICLVDLAILINWMNPFSILGVFGVLYHFNIILDRKSFKQTV